MITAIRRIRELMTGFWFTLAVCLSLGGEVVFLELPRPLTVLFVGGIVLIGALHSLESYITRRAARQEEV